MSEDTSEAGHHTRTSTNRQSSPSSPSREAHPNAGLAIPNGQEMATLPTLLQHASSTDKDTQLHLLPFHVSYAGPARVSSYFTPEPSSPSSSSSSSTAYFRGRLLRGVEVQLPEGYTGQLWRSNAPSVSVTASTSSSNHKNTSAAAASGMMDEEYNAGSPRRSPRKHAHSANQADKDAAHADKKQKTGTSGNANVNAAKKMAGKNKPKAAKRQRFAMSPDASPVKEEETNGGERDGVNDIPQEATAMLIDNDDKVIAGRKEEQQEQVDSDTSSPAVQVATSPAKPVLSQAKEEDTEEVAVTSGTAAFERASTPPPPSTPALIPPSTPASASAAALPIHVLSPSTPRTPGGRISSSMFGSNAFQSPTVDNEVDDADINDGKRTHQRLIQPIAHFGKITIWNPDVELDAGDDCYVKTLAEWPMLAELIHA